jgi:hypothetical protein
MRARKRDPDRPVTGDDVEARLARRVQIWAQTWRRCPKKGCRRASRCLRFNDCAGVSKAPFWPSAKEKRLYWDPIHAAIRAERGGPRHDPDARERPGLSSRASATKPPAPDHDPGGASPGMVGPTPRSRR